MSNLYTKDNIEAFILTSNQKGLLNESINSLLNQSIGEIDITVIDFASTDGTGDLVWQLMQKHSNLHYEWKDSNNLGIENIQEVIQLAKKDYVIILNDEGVLHPDYVNYSLDVINRYPNVSIVSSCSQAWSNPTNKNWAKASKRHDYCLDKKMFANYLYRMQRFGHSCVVYKTQNLREHFFNQEYYSQFGNIVAKPFVVNTMKDNNAVVMFRSKRLLRLQTHLESSERPNYDAIIAYNKFFKSYMQDSLYSKFMYNIVNYKQLKSAYIFGRDYTLSLKEFIQKAIDAGAGAQWTRFCIIPIIGKIFSNTASLLRRFFKTPYIRKFY